MNIKNYYHEAPYKEISSLEKVTELQHSEHVQIIHMLLKPGDYIKMHKTPMEVSFFLSHGKLDMQIGEEKQTISAGSVVESPIMIPHGFKNTYKEIAKILVIKHKSTQQ